VEPKRLALAQANTELAQAQDKLAVIKKKVAVNIAAVVVPSYADLRNKRFCLVVRGAAVQANGGL